MKRLRWLVLGLLLAATAYAGWTWRGDSGAPALAKQLEAAQLEAANVVVAHEATLAELDKLVAEHEPLYAEIKRLASLANSKPRLREVVKWRTEEIRVPVEHIVEGASPSCPLPPEIVFDVRGAEARLVTKAGNVIATGSVELWRSEPPPPELLGTAAWDAPLTSLILARDKPPTSWRAIATLGATTDEQLELGVVFHRQGRWGWYTRADYALDPATSYQPYSESYSSSGEWALGAGVALTLGRK